MTHHHQSHKNTHDLRLAFALNLGFAVLEIAGGLFINSVAILSDALHDLGDSFSLGLAWGLQNVSEKSSDKHYSYGYRRFSLLGAFINTIILIIGSLLILSEAFRRLQQPEAFSAPGMIIFAIIGVIINGIAAYRLRDNQSSNAQVVGLHLLEDVLGWIVVLIVGVISLFVNLPILDPILSILITLYILVRVVARLRQSADLFLQAVPENIDLDAIQQQLSNIAGIKSLHHTHLWSLDGEHHVFTTHLVVADDTSAHDIMRVRRQSQQIVHDLNLEHITIAVEYESEDCIMR